MAFQQCPLRCLRCTVHGFGIADQFQVPPQRLERPVACMPGEIDQLLGIVTEVEELGSHAGVVHQFVAPVTQHESVVRDAAKAAGGPA